jgi:DtxR family Mn-dependent transcriptional regulator
MSKKPSEPEKVSALSAAGEDYLKAIYKLQADGVAVTTQALASRLGVAAPSATSMVKKLASMHLVRHAPYRGVELTSGGERIALEVIRHHRLIETYLAEVLGVEWDKVHDEAERWEHVLSEEVEARMDAVLGGPTRDPHGAPIPTIDGRIERDGWERLSGCAVGAQVVVRRVSDQNAETLRHLHEVGLVPGAQVDVLRSVVAEGVLQLRIGGKRKTVGAEPARMVFVAPLHGHPSHGHEPHGSVREGDAPQRASQSERSTR